MSSIVLLDTEIIAGPLRLTSISNETSFDLEAADLDNTVFGLQGWTRRKAGLKSATISTSGFWDAVNEDANGLGPDAELWNQFGTSLIPVILSPTGAELGVAYIVPTTRGDLSMLGEIGEIAPYSSEMRGNAAARGAILHSPATIETADDTGASFVLGTIPAGKSAMISINVLALGGTSPQLTVDVERDDNAGYTSATTVATVGPVGAPTAQLTTLAGPITPDDRYRCTWTLTGTDPTARFAVAVGTT